MAEIVFVYIYTVEAIIKIIGFGLIFQNFEGNAYLLDGWNILDGTIVITSLISLYLLPDPDVVYLPSETGPEY